MSEKLLGNIISVRARSSIVEGLDSRWLCGRDAKSFVCLLRSNLRLER